MEWTETERGGLKLVMDGFVYVKKKNLANGWESYECELRRNRNQCKARVKVFGADRFRDKTEHNHPPDHGKVDAYKLKAAMKRRAVSSDESPHQILMSAVHQATDEGLMALPGLTSMQRIIRRQRQDHRESLALKNAVFPAVLGSEGPPLSTEGGQLVHPNVDNLCQGDREALMIRNPVDSAEVPEDQESSVSAESGPMVVPVVGTVGTMCHDDRKATVSGNWTDTGEGPMASPGLKNMRQADRVALASESSKDPEEVPEDQRSGQKADNPEILVRPLHSTLLKRSLGHKATSPPAKVPTGTIRMVPNIPVTSQALERHIEDLVHRKVSVIVPDHE